MKLTLPTAISLGVWLVPSYAALTKGYVQIKGASFEKGINLSTLFDDYDGDIIASNTATPLEVHIDLDKAQNVDTDIEILNGFWTDLYRYLGVSARDRPSIGSRPYVGFISVQQTPDAQPQQKENAFTASYPNPMSELPFQASAIWRYDPSQGGKLTPSIYGLDGTRLSVAIYGGGNQDSFGFNALVPNAKDEPLDFYFVPAA